MNEIIPLLNRLQRTALVTGLLFLVVSGLGAIFDSRDFFISYLFAFIFWFGLTLGCLLLAMIHYLSGGQWGNVTRRFLEAGFMTLPLTLILFLPILLGLGKLYPWAQPAIVAADKLLQQKAAYDNVPAFLIRTVAFFGIWLLLALRLRKWSLLQDSSREPTPGIKLRFLSGPGVCVVPLVATFAFIDWIMSLEPAWFSTMFAIILLAGEILTAIAFIIILLAWFQPHLPFAGAITKKACLDLGNLLLAFVMFWTYVSFSQFLITYSGNLPHEIDWYLHRITGGWKWLIIAMALFHFFIPFLMLLSRGLKEDLRRLALIAGLLFFVHALEIFWIIIPAFYPQGFHLHWLNFTVWFAVGGFWLADFAVNLKRHPLLAQNLQPTEGLLPQPANAR